MTQAFDYIICGAGLAGLSLAFRLCDDHFKNKSILLLDQESKVKNDRTFCHWAKEKGMYEAIVHKSWNTILFDSPKTTKTLSIDPYSYKMIRGDDFYAYNLEHIKKSTNISFKKESIQSIDRDRGTVTTNNNMYQADYIFKSFLDKNVDFSKSHYVIQHFMGWFVETPIDVFDPNQATFMDFNIDQDGEVRFMYVLPESKRKALIELAIFSNELLEESAYEGVLKNYVSQTLQIKDYNIVEKEKGSIPMTTFDFAKYDSQKLIHIGSAAGIVKPSSGYAFQRIQEHSDEIISHLKNGKHPSKAQTIFKAKYKLYDKIFLNAILKNKTTGEIVFSDLFKSLAPQLIFKFLDEKTSFMEDLKVFTGPPTLPFLKAYFEELF